MQLPSRTTEKRTHSSRPPLGIPSRSTAGSVSWTGYPASMSVHLFPFRWMLTCHAYSLTEQKVLVPIPVSPAAACPPFSEDDSGDYVAHLRDAVEKDYKLLDGASPPTPAAPLTLPDPAYRRKRPHDLLLTHSHWRRMSGFEDLFYEPRKVSTLSESAAPQPGLETTGVPGRF